MKWTVPLALALALTAGDALAVTARWQKHWRRHSHAPPLPYPDLLYPQDAPPLSSGFLFTVTKPPSGDKSPETASINRPRDIGVRIASCWNPPPSQAHDEREITVRLQFTKNGAVIGEPRITYLKPGPGEHDREALVQSIRAALTACTPMQFTGSLGPAIAGYPFAIRFIAVGNQP